ncbi:hypothetical protein BC829DRAFT_392033 [Chytridium lagenaria]|nr:hypothetical protein BC829DRAFT_392033 [Chytridium lagenaria]
MYRVDTNTPTTLLPQPHSSGDRTSRTISIRFPNPNHHLIQQTINPSPIRCSHHTQVPLPQPSPALRPLLVDGIRAPLK